MVEEKEEGKERESKRTRNRLDDILSSDDDQTEAETKVNVRPRQRSFRRRAKQEFTNELTPDQLVRGDVSASYLYWILGLSLGGGGGGGGGMRGICLPPLAGTPYM